MAFYHNRFGDYIIERPGGNTDLTGNRLAAVPDRIFNVGGSYEPIDDVGVTARFKYVSDRFAESNNILLLDSYQLLDASVWWSPGPVRFTLTAHNLLDERYFPSGNSTGENVNVGWPRQLMLIASYVYTGGRVN